MGDNTTIGLLTNINNSLGKIVEMMLPQNQDAKKKQEDNVKNLSQGGLSSGTNAAKAAEPSAGSVNGLNVAQIVSSLDGLPEQVKLIAKLSGKTIKNFEQVLNSIVEIFTQDAFKSLDKSSEIGVNLVKTLTELSALPETIKNIGKIKDRDVRRFTESILEIAKIFNTDEMKSIGKESKNAIDLMKSLTELGKLPEALKDVSKIKERQVKSFTKVVTMLLDMITKSLRKSGISDKDIKLAKKTADTISALTTAVKSLAKMTLIAPLAMVGVLAMIPVWLTFSAVLMLIGLMEKPIQKGLRALRGVDRFMTKMLKTALLGIAVAGGIILLGLVLKKNMDLMLYGLAGMMAVFIAVGVIAVLGGLIGLLIKSTNLFDKQIIKFTLELMLIAGLTIMLGMLLQVGWKQALFGLGGMLAVMLAMLGIALLIGFVGEVSKSSIKAMAGVLLLMLASMAITGLSILLGKYLSDYWDYALIGFAATTAILGEVFAIALLAKTVAKDAKSGVKNLLIAEGVILGAMAIVWATIKTGELVWDYFGTDTGTALAKVAIIGAVTTGIIFAAWGVTKIAKRAEKDIKKGAIALLLAEGVILASAIVALAVIGVSKVMESVESDSLTNTLLTMATIVGAAGAVAVVASNFQSSIKKGVLAMVVLEALVLGMVGVMHALVMTAKAATEIGWENVFITVGSMIVLLGLFAGLTAAFALLANPVTMIALAAGGAVMLSISMLILAVTGATMTVIKLSEMMDKSGKTTEELGELLHSITHDVFSYDNLNPEISVVQAAKLSAKYLLLMPALLGITAVVTVISDIAKKFGGLSEMRGDGYYVSPYYGMNGNEPVFGEPVNISKIAENIVQAITIFSNNLFEGFERVDLKRLFAVGITMQSLVEPVSRFAQMVSGFKEGEGPGSLKPVFVSQDGNIRYGESVNVVNVAIAIAGAISAFATELYGNGDEVPKWMKFMGRRKNRKRLERAMNTFALIIEPVEKFVNLIVSYQSAGPGMLKKASFDEQGNFVDNGAPAVDVKQVAYSIAGAISTFATTLFGDGDTLPDWMRIFKREKNADAVTKAMNTLGNVIAPIESFINALTMIEPSGSDMYYVWVDDKGQIQRKKVFLKSTALAIAGAVSEFVETLFGPTTANAWKAMLDVAHGGQQIVIGGGKQESPFSVFGEIIDPIANFVRVLSDIGGETKGDSLVLPLYDKDGKRVGEKDIDLTNTARIIADAVTEFVSTLFSAENKNLWLSLIYPGFTSPEGTYSKDTSLKDSIGVFAAVIDPVVKFAEILSKFGGTANDFKVYDGEKERSINLTKVATAIANAVTKFMFTLKPAFDDLKFGVDEKNKICDFATVVGDILGNFAKIGELKIEQIKVANSIIDSYNIAIQKITKTVNTLPEIQLVNNMEEIMKKCLIIFSIFKDTNFAELNYKEGLEQVKLVFTQCAAISNIAAKVDKESFDIIDRFVKAANVLKDCLIFNTVFSSEKIDTLNYYLTAITDISTTYADVPLIPDTDENRKKLWFIEPFLAAAVLINNVISTDSAFASNTKALLDFITGMGNSMLALGATPANDLDDVSKAYATLLERVIKLSDKRNVKSVSAMNDVIKEATTRMTKLDDRLIKHANDRKKKLDELIETVGNLNEKLEKTANSMEDIAKDLEKISKFDEDTIKRNIDAANGGSRGYSGKSFESGGRDVPVVFAGGSGGGSATSVDDIQEAIINALKTLKFAEQEFNITLDKNLLDALTGGSGIGGSGSATGATIRVEKRDTEILDKNS